MVRDQYETYDWDKIIGNNRQIVAIDAESLNSFGSSVDQPKSVSLAGCEFELGDSRIVGAWSLVTGCDGGTIEVHLAVYEIVVGCWSRISAGTERCHYSLNNIKILTVIVVCQEHWSNINIIWHMLGAVDDHRSQKATCSG